MAVRIRKLAKQLGKDPVEIVGVLHALGFRRFKSVDDMLKPDIEAKLRKGLRAGVAPVATDVEDTAPRRGPASVESVAASDDDVMARLMPDVTPTGRARPAPKAPRAAPKAAPPSIAKPAPATMQRPAPAPSVDLDEASAATRQRALDARERTLASREAVLGAEREALDADAARLTAREQALRSQQEAVAQLEAGLAAEREALAAERASLRGAGGRKLSDLASLQDVFEARGLRGADEFERALVALASARLLRDVLWALRVDAPEQVAHVLTERMVLAEAGAPEQMLRGAAVVEVAPDRAEVPGAAALSRALDGLGERLMLQGATRLLVVGGAPRWQRVLAEGLDDRIEVRTVPTRSRSASEARDDVAWADAIVLWDVDVSAEARALYDAGRPVVLSVQGASLQAALDGLARALQAV